MPTTYDPFLKNYVYTPEKFVWGVLVVIYLYTAGISAGMFATSGLATYVGGERYRRLARLGALLAPWPLMLGLFMLIFDLGRPLFFWHLMTTVQWTSPMSIGSWLLTFFVLLSLIYLIVWLPFPFRNLVRVPTRREELFHPRRWPVLSDAWTRRARGVLAAIGFPVSIGVAMYTGVLLGAIPSRPFWNTPLVAQLFLFSAMSTGVAFLLLAAALIGGWMDPEAMHEERHLLVSLDAVLIIFEIFMIIPFFLHQALNTWSSAVSVRLILGGPYTGLFWIGVIFIGLLIPLAIEGYELFPVVLKEGAVKYSRELGIVSALFVLIGGFILRYVFVYAGQMSHLLPIIAR